MPPHLTVYLNSAQSMSITDLVALHRMAPRISTLSIAVARHDEAPRDAVYRFSELTSLACTYCGAQPIVAPGLDMQLPARLRVLALWSVWTLPLHVVIVSPAPVLEELRVYGFIRVDFGHHSMRSVRRIGLRRDGDRAPQRVAALIRNSPSLEQLAGVELGTDVDIDVIASCATLRQLALDRVHDPAPAWSKLSALSALSTVGLPYDCARLAALSYDAAGGGLSAFAALPALKHLTFRLGGEAMAEPARELLRLHAVYISKRRRDLRISVLHATSSSLPDPSSKPARTS
jgi:hypothetical protein